MSDKSKKIISKEYVSLVREREFVGKNESTYLYDFTSSANILKDLSDILPTGSEIILIESAQDNVDDIITERLDAQFEKTEECGKTYYTGNIDVMTTIIRNTLSEVVLHSKTKMQEHVPSTFHKNSRCNKI